jgi:hypothetical protein
LPKIFIITLTPWCRPPLNKLSLFFEETQMERDYKRTAWRLKDAKHSTQAGRAWSSATLNAYFDLASPRFREKAYWRFTI